MRKLILFIFLFSSQAVAAGFYEPPPVHREALSNGLVLFALEDHELPTIELILFVRDAGSVRDPKGKEGLALIAMDGIRLGGTRNRPPAAIEEELESMGAVLEMGANAEWGYASLKLLRKDLEKGIEILFDLLKNPVFDPGQVELIKNRAIERTLRGDEEPMERGMKEFARQVYGRKSPWGKSPSPKLIRKINQKDLIAFHKKYFAPNRLVVAVSGDLAPTEMVRSLKIQTIDWPSSTTAVPPLPKVNPEFESGRWFVASRGLKQATILIGHLGERRDSPDKFSLLVADYILGGSGSLSSRLGERIRTEEGKAYGVWSHYGFGPEAGLFYTAAQTEGSQTKEVVEGVTEIVRKMASEPEISDEELVRARQAILSSFYFVYETSFSLVKDLAKFYLWGYPDDYLETFQRGVSSLTREDLEKACRQHLHPEGLKTVIVADRSVLEGLKSLGKFKVIKR